MDIEDDESRPGAVKDRGVFAWGFDYFLLPHSLLEVLRSERAMPVEFRIGEPWWDYALPILALALGFPVKRLMPSATLALHYVHPTRFGREVWVSNFGRFMDFAQRLLERTPNSAVGLLTDIVSRAGDPEFPLHRVSQLICQTLP